MKTKKLPRWLTDEQGQASTEYVLMLATAVMGALLVIQKLIRPVFTRLLASTGTLIEKKFFGSDLHTYRVRR